jgi:hypothetical protein
MNIHHLAIRYGSICNLKCKYCAEFNPYFSVKQREAINCEQTILDISKIATICDSIDILNVSGGEALLNQDIDKLLESLLLIPNIREFYLVTNGSVVPSDSVLTILAQHKKRVRIEISGYAALNYPKNEVLTSLKRYKIPYNIRKTQVWYDVQTLGYRDCSVDELKSKFRNCRLSGRIWDYTDGYLCMSCCRPNRLFFLNKWDECENEWIKVSDTPIEKIGEEMGKIEQLDFSNICRYCGGVFDNTPQVIPAKDQL